MKKRIYSWFENLLIRWGILATEEESQYLADADIRLDELANELKRHGR